jgi:hypothetical protein
MGFRKEANIMTSSSKFFLALVIMGLCVPVVFVRAETYPVLVIDGDLPSVVGNNFMIEVHALDGNSNYNLQLLAYFDDNKTYTGFNATADYFLDYQMNIKTFGHVPFSWILDTAENHTLTIEVRDWQDRTASITTSINIDNTPPTISEFSITGYETIGEKKIVYFGTSIMLTWKVSDNNFDRIEIYKYSIYGGEKLVASVDSPESYRSIAFDLDTSIRERDFDIFIRVYDKAGNWITSEKKRITYIDDREYKEPEDTQALRKQITIGIISIGAIIVLGIGVGVAIAVKLQKTALKGFRLDLRGKKLEDFFEKRSGGKD